MKFLFFFIIATLIGVFGLSAFGGELKLVPKMPKCVRPVDFSNGKFVSSYEACIKRQDLFCETHKEDKNCLERVQTGKPYYKTTTDDIEPSKRCTIERDDSYKCLQDPIRIIVAEEAKANPSASSTPSGTPAIDPKAPNGTPDENGSASDEKNPPVVLPPPPHPH